MAKPCQSKLSSLCNAPTTASICRLKFIICTDGEWYDQMGDIKGESRCTVTHFTGEEYCDGPHYSSPIVKAHLINRTP